jgi:hypothetical protein
MARDYNHLQLAAFRLRTDVPWQRRLYLLRFPEHWKKPLTTLSRPRRDGSEIQSVPIWLLNQVIDALVPDVITVATNATVGPNAPWIYSDTEVNTESLFAIIATWGPRRAPTPPRSRRSCAPCTIPTSRGNPSTSTLRRSPPTPVRTNSFPTSSTGYCPTS